MNEIHINWQPKIRRSLGLTPVRGRDGVAGGAALRGRFSAGFRLGKNNLCFRVFTPCRGSSSLLEKINLTAHVAVFGDVILLSPACSSFNQFRVQESGEELFQDALNPLADAIGGRHFAASPNRLMVGNNCPVKKFAAKNYFSTLCRGFLRKNPGAKQPNQTPSHERTLSSANNP